MDHNITCVWLMGEMRIEGRWLEWYEDMAGLFRRLGYKPTHFSVRFSADKRGRFLSVSRKEKEILQRFSEGENPVDMHLYVYPPHRENNLDTIVHAFCNNFPYSKDLFFTIDSDLDSDVDPEEIMEILKKYAVLEYGEIFKSRDISNLDAMMYEQNRGLDVELGRKWPSGYLKNIQFLKIYKEGKYADRTE